MPYIQPLFRTLDLRSVTLANRIALSPMCQYSARDGVANDWHVQHAGARAAGGAGLVMLEAVNVSPAGMLTPGCLGLWNNEQQAALARIAALVERCGSVPAVQVGHAGRKACTEVPWDRGLKNRWEGSSIAIEDGGWETVGPSPIAFKEDMPAPHELTPGEIAVVIEQFADTARRAREAGFKVIEIHGAHGYLIHSFRSPVSNVRQDAYGGSPRKRRRFLMEVLEAVRAQWSEDLPIFLRISCSEYVEGGLDIADSIELARDLRQQGIVDLVDCSSGGGAANQRIPSIHSGYQVPFAEAIRREAGIATGAVGLIDSPLLANEIIGNGRADLVLVGRAMLGDPAWPMRAAKALGAAVTPPPPYRAASYS